MMLYRSTLSVGIHSIGFKNLHTIPSTRSHYIFPSSLNQRMCEFCLYPPGSDRNSDSFNPDFQGFFSTAAIEQVVAAAAKQGNDHDESQQSKNDDNPDEDEDDDGT